MNEIIIEGARENNLKNISIKIPRDKLVVFTGVSGSGKSTLAFDTIFAEGQRRYVESLSSYARQFLGQLSKPDVDKIEGLSPAIAIDQKTTNNNPRSTVGTVTEIYDYFRLLYARAGTPYCPECGKKIERQTVDDICDSVMAMEVGSKILIKAPVVRRRKGEYSRQLEGYKKSGFSRVEIDGIIYDLTEEIKLDKNLTHDISVVVDRLIVKQGIEKRLSESLETALKLGEGLVTISCGDSSVLYSTKYACSTCGINIEELEPRLFSFNNPQGACPVCNGLGYTTKVSKEKLYKDGSKSLNQGALSVTGWNIDTGRFVEMYFRALSKKYNFSLDTPIKDLPEDILNIILYGTNGEVLDLAYSSKTFSGSYSSAFEGVIPNLERRYRETSSDYIKGEIERYMETCPCHACKGKRLKKEALAVRFGEKNISELCDLSAVEIYEYIGGVKLNKTQEQIAELILKEIRTRLKFLMDVGLDYLTLSRSAGTLSGGEAQRIRLATQIGSGLTGVLYILDEPSIGLHQRDNEKLLNTLANLRNLGNTLIVVEHDEDTMRFADHIVDIGRGAGVFGGEVIAQGTWQEIAENKNSLTGDYLSGRRSIPIPTKRRVADGRYLEVIGANQNNLKNINVKIPVGLFTVITGVSGSGKSSLVNEIIYPYLANRLNRANEREGNCKEILGVEHFDKVINIDQSPIGRTPRSNPATYTGVFTYIRELFAASTDAKSRGYTAGRFSFNIAGGRCEHCQGDGILKIEMSFLPDVFVPCEVCKGKRFNRETLQVKYKGKSIFDVLDMTVDEACEFFEPIPRIYNKIKCLQEVGLGYIKLGQNSTTLSGGEAQRVKLATELSRRSTGKTIYILDEPTTGLHIDDVSKILDILTRFTENNNTVVVIEHNLDVIKVADHIIDLGPEGGGRGGEIIATGSPEEVAQVESSHTGRFIKKILTKGEV